MADNNPAATQSANATYAAANPGVFSGGSNSGSSSGGSQYVPPANSVSDSASGANTAALAAGVKAGTVTGSLDAQGNYVPPSATSANLQATGTVSGQTPTVPNATATGTASSATPLGLQMPTGAAANTQFDPATGQQENPSKAAFDQMKASGTAAPQDSASGVSGANSATTASTPTPAPQIPPVVTSFLQSPSALDIQNQLKQQLMPQATTDELNAQIQAVNTDKTILAGLNTQYMNIQTVMAGSKSDIASEIAAAGGFVTESQIDALTVSRNQTLLKQSAQLQNLITSANQTVANDTSLLTDEKDMAATAFNENLSTYQAAQTQYNNGLNAAKDSFNAIITAVGYNGLYTSLMQTGGAQAVNHAEQVLGLSGGQLQGLGVAQTAAMGSADIKSLMTTYADAGIQPTDTLAQAQAKVLQSPTYKADLGQKQAAINASNTSSAKNEADIKVLNQQLADGGLTQAEYTKQAGTIKNNQDITTYVDSQKGSDGYISPTTYSNGLAAYVQDQAAIGITAHQADYDNLISDYLNPNLIGTKVKDYQGAK